MPAAVLEASLPTTAPQTPVVHQLFYVSRASKEYDDAAIESILRSSRTHNPARGVTGCLLFSGTCFAQVLEGDGATIVGMVERIAADPRHRHLRLLLECVKPARDYGEWSMGYLHDLALEDALESLLHDPARSPDLLTRVMARMRPDQRFGAVG